MVERCQQNVVDRHVDTDGEAQVTQTVARTAAAHSGQFTESTNNHPVGSTTASVLPLQHLRLSSNKLGKRVYDDTQAVCGNIVS